MDDEPLPEMSRAVSNHHPARTGLAGSRGRAAAAADSWATVCSGAEEGAVDPGQRRAWVASAQHDDLVTEDQDLGILGCVGSGECASQSSTRASSR